MISMAFHKLVIIILLLSSCSAVIIKRESSAWNFWRDKAWGANLGNWLVLERWMNPSFFEQHAPNSFDEWSFSQEDTNATETLKQHWRTWITEDDFSLLASVGANHVRIPVGYWAFVPAVAGEPYVTDGQKEEIERILGYCAKYNIYAIIVFHGLPGSQNSELHSGRGGYLEFYQNNNLVRSLQTIQAAVDWMNALPIEIKSMISAIEPVNEPHIGDDASFRILWNFYKNAYDIIHKSAYQIPMIFSDGWRSLDDWQGLFPANAYAVVDSHIYYAFNPDGNAASIQQDICDKINSIGNYYLPVIVGEYSLAAPVASNDEWKHQFLDTQVSAWNHAAGGLMWSLKNGIGSSEWSFEELVHQGVINNRTFTQHLKAAC